ncbi:polyprenyl synthetase family protein [Candidatus Sumerlaeota bacterium]|nr:polyprenyl synthetase family protein [Candidatus Sumerlaeota bacterium]
MKQKNWEQTLDDLSRRIDAALSEFLESHREPAVPNLHDGLLYALGLDQPDAAARGKRIRPSLCLIACEALDGDPARAMPVAIAFELMHNFFLVHDDIEDGDRFRRGRPSVWTRYGLAHGVNIGDFLLAKVFEAVLAARADLSTALAIELTELIVETLRFTHVGQTQDLNARSERDIDVDRYLEIVTNKTGYYLAAPIVAGAMIAGASSETLSAIRGFGRCAGPVFQITDDIIDLTESKGREQRGSDIREGKRSFLVAHAAARTTNEERDDLFRILDLPRDETTPEDVDRVRALFEKYGSPEAGRTLCRESMEKAREELAPVPEELRTSLLGVFEWLLNRNK